MTEHVAPMGARHSLKLCSTRVLLDRIRACSFVRLTRVLRFSFWFPFSNVIVNLLLKKNSNSAAALRRCAECILNRTLTRVHCSRPPASKLLTRVWANPDCRSWEGIDVFVSLANCNVSWEIICFRCSKGHLWNSYLSPTKSWESLRSFKGRN